MDTTVTVTETADVGPDTVSIAFETPEGFDAQPGQFVKLSAEVDGERYARFYTVSSPDMVEEFEITIGIDPEEGGPFSEHLAHLSAGDAIDMSGPFGSDYYEDEPRVVVLAGGPGIGPAVGIGGRVLNDGGELAIVYKDDATAHEDRLSKLDAAGASVAITDGSIIDAVAAALTGRDDEQVFVYGFADFVDEAVEAVEAAGSDPDDLKVENFG